MLVNLTSGGIQNLMNKMNVFAGSTLGPNAIVL